MNPTNDSSNEAGIEQRQSKGKAKLGKSGPAQRDSSGRFRPGSAANPNGRPLGSRNRKTLLLEQLLDERAEAILAKVMAMALEGHVLALKLCVERLLPVCREREMPLRLPAPGSAEGIAAGFEKVVEAITNGQLTPTETNSAATLLETARRSFETTELARRIDELESRVEQAAARDANGH